MKFLVVGTEDENYFSRHPPFSCPEALLGEENLEDVLPTPKNPTDTFYSYLLECCALITSCLQIPFLEEV